MGKLDRLKIVESLAVSTPCPDDTFIHTADKRTHGWYCLHCEKNVYDFKTMSRKEIAALVKKTDGHFCAVISRKADGSIITKEPSTAAASLISGGLLLASTALLPVQAFAEHEVGGISAPKHPAPEEEVTLGKVAVGRVEEKNAEKSVSDECGDTDSKQPVTDATPTPSPQPMTLRGEVSVYPPPRK